MTNREFFTIVAASNLPDDVKEFANSALIKMDTRNANRSAKPSKTQQENAPIKQALLEYLSNNEGQFTEGQLGEALGITHNKAGALARQLVAEGMATSVEVKLPKVGKRKAYAIAVAEIEVVED